MTAEVSRPPAGPRLAAVLALGVWALTVVLWAGALALLPLGRAYRDPAAAGPFLRVQDLLDSLGGPVLAALGAVIVLRSSRRRYGWLMLSTGCCLAVLGFALEYSRYALITAPGTGLPLPLLAVWVQDLWMIPLMLIFCLPFLFPDGDLPSRRWGAVFWPTTTGWSLVILVWAFVRRPAGNAFMDLGVVVPNPYGIIAGGASLETGVQSLFATLVPLSALGGMASLAFRYRRAGPEVRQQIKWVLFALVVVVAIFVASYVNQFVQEIGARLDLGLGRAIYLALQLSLLALAGAVGAAVLKYRLFDIDLIIHRTLVYGALTVLIGGGYVFLVTALGSLLPAQPGILPALLATAAIAVAFAPLRDRLQRVASRLLFGAREEPYDIVRNLGQRLESSGGPEDVLPAVAETIAHDLKLPRVEIRLKRGDHPELGARHGPPAGPWVDFPLRYQSETIGRLSVGPRRAEPELGETDMQLLRQIARLIGPVAHASLLAQDVRASNARMLVAREEERRRLYRDLHDGLGPTLASQTLKLDCALDLLSQDPERARTILLDLKSQTQGLVVEIRRLVYALRSSRLDELGLVGALREYVQGFPVSGDGLQISFETPPGGLARLPAALEAAAYRIALEAITNVVRHAEARRCRVHLEVADGTPAALRLTVEDDGRGLEKASRSGVGLASMVQRSEELGGRVTLVSKPQGGIRVVAELPLPP